MHQRTLVFLAASQKKLIAEKRAEDIESKPANLKSAPVF
jgi:hypothetical protein